MPFPAVNPALARALAAQGYNEPTPVQTAVLANASPEADLLVSAQTGSGKTVAYGLAIAPTLLDDAERLGAARAPLALVIAPTRELAMQVERELAWLYQPTGARVVSCVGGMDPRREARMLAAGSHIVVGTPGRLRDHIERGQLDLAALRVVVLDEADEMLDLGFREELEAILDAAPVERRTLLFSATIAREIAALAKRYQRDAVRIDTTVRDEPHGDIEYRAVRIAPNEIEHAVVNVLRYEEAARALVFCKTREAVRHLNASLRERGFATVALSGDLSQKERSEALQAIRDGHARVCVATDVAARGIDLPDLGLVIHADLPSSAATLLHRSGRTGRAGRKGTSILLVPYPARRRIEQLLRSAHIEAGWSGPPLAEQIRDRDRQRLLQDPMLSEPAVEDELPLAQALIAERTPEAIALALVRLYRSRLPAPEVLFDGTPERREPSSRAHEPREPHRERAGEEAAAWFRLNVGRSHDADPKWLIPLICRRGHVTKGDIGQIRIFDRETKFEITREAEPRFTAALAAAPDDKVRIERAGAPTGGRPAGGRPGGTRSGGTRPAGGRPTGGRPAGGKPAARPRPASRQPQR